MRRSAVVTVLALMAMVFPSSLSRAVPEGTKVQTYKGGLAFPVDMAWLPGTKKVFFTEKNTGMVRVLAGRKLLSRPCVDLDVEADGERGALGVALHPNFKKNKWLYVFYTNASPLEHRVTRFKVMQNRCTQPKHVVQNLDASSSGYHNGGQLEFVNGKLFVSTGEAHDPAEAQSRTNRLGKILRLNPNGTIPDGNPFSTAVEKNPVWTYGHRNPFGLARKPGSNWLFSTENGPQCDDELNRIRKGSNYGWGSGYQCGTAGVTADSKPPLIRWTPTIVPTDPEWYVGRMKKLSGDLYFGDHDGGGNLHRIVLNSTGSAVRADRIIYSGSSGINDVEKGPGGWLYFVTTNGIMRIVPD